MRLPAQQSLAFTERPPVVRAFLDPGDLVIDFFAGGGGASTALAEALGRSPDIAINHDAEAIEMHKRNHPTTEHFTEDVFAVDPVVACRGRRVGAAWFSPTCTYFSRARGGPLSAASIKVRALCWVAVRWAAAVKPRFIFCENVAEFEHYGPLHRQHSECCDVGEVCHEDCKYLTPIAARRGETFRAFVRRLRTFYRFVEWRRLRACDYGAPTTRDRLFMIASDEKIAWPTPSHGPGTSRAYRTAAEIIDWSNLGTSIFERDRPLVDATLRRIARGVRRYVVETSTPFIAPVTGVLRGDHRLAIPYLIHRSNGERVGQAPRIYDIQKPLGTIVAGGNKHELCVAFLARHYGGHENDGQPVTSPLSTITVKDHHALVAAFLVRYNGTGDAESLERPIGTLTTKDRFALVTVTIHGQTWVIVDIRTRHLLARELFDAQGFPGSYDLSGLGVTALTRMVGNSVSPPPATATVRAQLEAA